jgi:resuscitation-promoting factor RpfB
MSAKTLLGCVAAGLVLASATGGLGHGKHHHHHHGGGGSTATVTARHLGGNVALGERMAAAHGWTGPEWSCLYTLWEGESNWDKYNTYPSHDTSPSTPGSAITTAYGIPQALPAQKMATAGADWQTSARTQIRWGIRYIAGTYGTPCAALAFKHAHGDAGY